VIWVRHAIDNLLKSPNFRTPWTRQAVDSLASPSFHNWNLREGADKNALRQKSQDSLRILRSINRDSSHCLTKSDPEDRFCL
jgi:hypothetical protein